MGRANPSRPGTRTRKRARCTPPDFELWQWQPVVLIRHPDTKVSDELYKELYEEEHDSGTKRAARCRVCAEAVQLQGNSLGNFKIHLGRCHPQFLLPGDNSLSYGPKSRSSGVSPAAGESLSGTILQFATSGRERVSTSDLAQWVTQYCVEGSHPLRQVESPEMRDLLCKILRATGTSVPKLPSRYMAESVVETLVGEHKAALAHGLTELIAAEKLFPGLIAVTADTWTSRSVQGYLGVTIAYIDANWTLHSEIVACKPLAPPHSAPVIKSAIAEAVPAPATVQHIISIVTDNGSNFVSAADGLVGDRAMRCAAHTIQLVLKDVAKAEPLASALKSVLHVLARFSKSASRRQALRRAAGVANIKALLPILPVATRWDSNYYAMRRFLDLYPAFELMTYLELGFATAAERKAAWGPVADARAWLESLCDVLQVFARWTKKLQSARTATLSQIPAAVEDMRAATTPQPADGACVSEIKEQLAAAVSKRLVPLAHSTLVRIACFLDPTQHHCMMKEALLNESVQLTKALFKEQVRLIVRTVDVAFKRARVANSATADDSDDSDLEQEVDSFHGWPARELVKAIKTYHSCDKSAAREPLTWWRENARDLRPLDSVARWFLCIPATSAESERTFSLAGWIVAPKRCRLSGARVNNLVLLQRHLLTQRGRAAMLADDGRDSRDAHTPAAQLVDLAAGQEADSEHDDDNDDGYNINLLLDEGFVQVTNDGVVIASEEEVQMSLSEELCGASSSDGAICME